MYLNITSKVILRITFIYIFYVFHLCEYSMYLRHMWSRQEMETSVNLFVVCLDKRINKEKNGS